MECFRYRKGFMCEFRERKLACVDGSGKSREELVGKE